MIIIVILSIRSNGDQMNNLLLILHFIPISTPPSIDHNSAVVSGRLESLLSSSWIYVSTYKHKVSLTLYLFHHLVFLILLFQINDDSLECLPAKLPCSPPNPRYHSSCEPSSSGKRRWIRRIIRRSSGKEGYVLPDLSNSPHLKIPEF